MRRFAGSLCVLFTTVICCTAQDLRKDYQPVQSNGALPLIFTQKFSEKTARDLNELKQDSSSYNTKVAKKDFLIRSNFYVDRIIRGGSLLFNDSLSIYVNKVMDVVLQSNPELRKKV